MIFIDNRYRTIYDALIEKRKREPLSKVDCYCETHHILPRSLGGTDDADNLINLSPREHYLAHKLLTRFTSGNANRKMWWALHRMCFSGSHRYEKMRIEWSKWIKENHPSKNSKSWHENLSNAVYGHWEDNKERREVTREKFNETINKWRETDPDGFMAEQRRRAKLGAQAAKAKMSARIEYYGETYVGWKQFQEETGVSKHLYKRYYVNGINPKKYIGVNAMSVDVYMEVVRDFCEKTNELVPISKQDAKPILDRMKTVGLIGENGYKLIMDTMR